VTVRLSRARK